nr:prenyltransferase [Cytophagales bacterium]
MDKGERSPIFTLKAFVKIIRPNNLCLVAFVQLLTAYFLIGTSRAGVPVLQDLNLYLLIVSTVILTASGYMINDYYDVKIDYVNKPDEVVIGKGMKRRMVMILHTMLNFFGILLGYVVDPRIGFINFVAAFLLWLYSNSLKRLPFIGNLTVASLTGLSVWIIGFYYQQAHMLILTYAIFAFFINLIREIIKDIEDRQGDRKHGCKTLPIVVGFRNTKKIIFAVAAMFVFSIFLVTITINDIDLFLYFGGLGLLFMFFLYKLYVADRKKQFSQLSFMAKILMLSGAISMAFL